MSQSPSPPIPEATRELEAILLTTGVRCCMLLYPDSIRVRRRTGGTPCEDLVCKIW